MTPFLAVDWGTSKVRAWRIDADGLTSAQRELPLGVSKIEPGQAQSVFAREIAAPLEAASLPALMCGMIGSNLGWTSVPYVDCPAGAAEIRDALVTVKHNPTVRIAPGLRCQGVAGTVDVMRGEETQLLGWMQSAPDGGTGRHIVCLPGTHAKWALIDNWRITRFVTAMTGELFEVLRTHSVLRSEDEPRQDDAFLEGLTAAGDGGALSTRLFSARARVVAGGADNSTTSSYLSGLLIGAEAAAVPPLLSVTPREPIIVVGAAALAQRYKSALEARGYVASVYGGDEAVLSGLKMLVQQGVFDDA